MNLLRRNLTLLALFLATTATPAFSQTVVDITNGQTLSGVVEAKQPGFSGVLGSTQYRATLPGNTNYVFIMVAPTTVTPYIPDLDIAVRFGQPVTISEGQLVYDLYANLDDFTGIESIEVENPTTAGDWYIGIVNFEEFAAQYNVTLMITTGPTPTPTTAPPTSTPTQTPTPIVTPTATPTPTTPAATPTPTSPPAGSKSLTTGSYSGTPGNTVNVLVSVDEAQGLAGGQFTLSFDAGLLSAGAAQTESAIDGFLLKSNPQSGTIGVAFANALGASAGANAPLIRIPLTINGGASNGQSSSLTLSAAGLYNESAAAYSVSLTGGHVTVSGGPTATPTTAPTATPTLTPTLPPRQLAAGTYSAGAGQTFDVILKVSDGGGIAGGECELTFDGGLLSAGQAMTKSLIDGFLIKSNPESGRIRIATANSIGSGEGTDAGFVRIPMTVNAGATAGQTSALTIVAATLYNESTTSLGMSTANGSFQVSGTAVTPTPTPTTGATPTPSNTPTGGNIVTNPRADINRDGIVDYKDQVLLHANWHMENPNLQ